MAALRCNAAAAVGVHTVGVEKVAAPAARLGVSGHGVGLSKFVGLRAASKSSEHVRASVAGRKSAPRAAAPSPVETLEKTDVAVLEKSVNTIRFLAIDAVEKANSGHPGLPMGCAPMGHILYDEFMKYNPKNPYWFNRDRFVLSAGHGEWLLRNPTSISETTTPPPLTYQEIHVFQILLFHNSKGLTEMLAYVFHCNALEAM
jgi:hypothetical protein